MSAPLPIADQRLVGRAALRLLAADRRSVVLTTILSALAAAAGLGGPWLLGRIIDTVPAGATPTRWISWP